MQRDWSRNELYFTTPAGAFQWRVCKEESNLCARHHNQAKVASKQFAKVAWVH